MLFFPPLPPLLPLPLSPPPSPNSGLCAIVSISLRPPLSFMLSHMPPDATVLLYIFRVSIHGQSYSQKWCHSTSREKRLCEGPDGSKPPPRNICRCRVFVILLSPAFSYSFRCVFSHQIICIVFLKLSTVFEIIQRSSGSFLYQCLIHCCTLSICW